MATVNLTEQDIDYIGRVVATEVPGSLRRTNPREYERMIGAVVDTMANRLAVGSRYGKTIAGVANQRRAFSKITGPQRLAPYGSVQNTPKAPKSVQDIVNSHIAKRAQGVPSEVPGALDYANPFHSDQSNLRGWVNPMIDAGALKLGVGQAVHYHGLAPGNRPAPNVGYRTPAGFMPEIEPGMARQLGTPTPSPRPSTPDVERQATQRATMAGTGILGMDGRQSGTFSAPAGTVTRGPALQAAFDRMSGTPTASGYAQMERSRRQSEAPMSAPVGPVERMALPDVGASSFPARPAVIASNNVRSATPALDRALEQQGIARPTPQAPAQQQTTGLTRDPASIPAGPVRGRVVGNGIAPTFASDQAPAPSVSMPSFPGRPATIASSVARPALQRALQNAGLVTPGDPAPSTLTPSTENQQLSPVAGVPVTSVRARPVAPVAPAPRQLAPVRQAPRVVRPAITPPQPVQPVAPDMAPEPLSQEAFSARANPVTPGLRPGDVYNGAIGSARATGGNVVSRENSWGPTMVTNQYGVTTATMPDGKQAAVGTFNPFGGTGTGFGPKTKSVIGGIAGAALGSLIGGPTGSLLGGLLGKSLATGGLGGLGGSGRSQPGSGGAAGGGLGGLFGGGTVGNQRGGGEGGGGSQGAGIGGGGGRGERDRSRAY